MIQIVKEIDIQIQAALEPQAAQLVVNLSTTYSRQDFENKAGEVVLSALEEDLSSVPITHIWWHTTAHNCSSRGPVSLASQSTCSHRHGSTQRHAHNLKKKKDVKNTKPINNIKTHRGRNCQQLTKANT